MLSSRYSSWNTNRPELSHGGLNFYFENICIKLILTNNTDNLMRQLWRWYLDFTIVEDKQLDRFQPFGWVPVLGFRFGNTDVHCDRDTYRRFHVRWPLQNFKTRGTGYTLAFCNYLKLKNKILENIVRIGYS